MFKVNKKTYFTHCSDDSIVDFKQVNAGWEITMNHEKNNKTIPWVKSVLCFNFKSNEVLVTIH